MRAPQRGTWVSQPLPSPLPTRPADQPDLFISMPHVMLAGQPVEGAPAGEVEERACAAACRTTPDCNIYFWCPAEGGCSISLTNATGSSLAYRQCALAQQPNALPGQAHPPEAAEKGDAVAVTSGARSGGGCSASQRRCLHHACCVLLPPTRITCTTPCVCAPAGQIVPDMQPRLIDGYTIHMCLGTFGM